MIWQPTGAAQPILRIKVRPGGVVYTDLRTATIGIHGAGPSADEASLIRLVSLVAARLPGLTIRL